MSLFDVIKYQVSDNLTVAELEALPVPVFIEWREWVIANNSRDDYTTEKAVKKLRSLLANYDGKGSST